MYYADRYYYDLIPNPHVKVDGNKIIIVDHPFVRHSNTLPSNKHKDLYPKQHISSLNRPVPLNLYRSMHQDDRDTVIKSLYVDLNEKNIFILLDNLHLQIREQKRDLLNNKFSYNDEDVRCKFSVVYTNFRVRHPKLYGNIDRSILNHTSYYMFNKFTEEDDSYYLKYIYRPDKYIYGYIEKNPLTENYQYYECDIDKHIKLDFTKGKNYNEEAVAEWYHTYPIINDKLRKEWLRLAQMIICFEITYGRYLKDSAAMFKEADEKHEISIPRQKTPVHDLI
jgi:hypothetical protein